MLRVIAMNKFAGVSIDGSMPVYLMPGYENRLKENWIFDAFAEFARADASDNLQMFRAKNSADKKHQGVNNYAAPKQSFTHTVFHSADRRQTGNRNPKVNYY